MDNGNLWREGRVGRDGERGGEGRRRKKEGEGERESERERSRSIMLTFVFAAERLGF